MSCTENESGPFVVFFLPAVVGCLTILLARRWANSQVSGTSSTAVSRRRKIIKDPLIKRPLPPIACKMIPPGPKKAGLTKKGSLLAADEELNGGKRVRTSRVSSASSGGVVTPDVKVVEGPTPPKHIPFPYIPQDGELLFEVMTFVFTLAATGLQFLNLYRTNWWLPNSYMDQAMHFYLIDPHLVAFIVTILLRRLLFSLSMAILRTVVAPKLMPHATVAARMFVMGTVFGSMAYCGYFIMLKHPLVKIFYLCYPAVIYLVLFGFQASPFLELSNSESPPLHCCSHNPEQVRAEVDMLRHDFNMRVKKILFNSVTGAYYSSFIPCCFVQSVVYYDVYAASQQVALVWGALGARLAQHLAPAALLDVAHRAARHLGRWTVHHVCTEVSEGSSCSAAAWSGSRSWAWADRVCSRGVVLLATAHTVAAQPHDKHHKRFYAVFSNPSKLLCVLLCLQLALIVLQLCLLFSSIAWHSFLSIVILLFINYYTLFKLVRDYLVAWKVYKAENMIQDKIGIPQTLVS